MLAIIRAIERKEIKGANDEQVFRNILDFQRLGRGHHARIAEVKGLGHRGQGTDRQNRLLKFNELLAFVGLHAQVV